MAGRNEVSLTFVGDTVSLERANKRAQESIAATGKAFDKAADDAVHASKRMETVAEASDHVNTLGDKATSSLGALSSGFELLGPSGTGAAQGLMTAALATDFLSGASEAAVIATDTLKGALTKAKAAFSGLSSAAKIGVVSLGVVGVAALAAGAIFLAFKQHQEETKATVDALSQSLKFQGDAFKQNNRQVIAAKLEEKGLLETANKLGINQRDLTDAILAGGDALDKLVPKQVNVNKNSSEQAVLTQKLSLGTHELSNQVSLAKDQQGRLASATEDVSGAFSDQAVTVNNARDALKAYNQSLHDELDPAANLFHRIQDLRKAQQDYTAAVKEHGAKSQEAIDANVNLAETVLDARDAALAAQGSFSGKFTPSMLAAFKQAGLTKDQIRGLEKALKDTKAAGDKLDGQTFQFSVIEEQKLLRRNAFERNLPGRASGGPVSAGQTYLVGERGPEVVTFGSSGFVHDNKSSAAMSGGRMTLEIRSGGTAMDDVIVGVIEKAAKRGRFTVLRVA